MDKELIKLFLKDESVRRYLAEELAVFYTNSSYSYIVAMLCDEFFDRSGNMLGWIREIAEKQKAQSND